LGDFWRGVSNQRPEIKDPNQTRQGRYAFSAGGTLLGFNNNRDPLRLIAMLNQAHERWLALPGDKRNGSSLPSERDAKYDRTPPPGGLILKVFTRVLEAKAEGTWERVPPPTTTPDAPVSHRGYLAARDHCWIQASEIVALTPPAGAAPGTRHPLPDLIVRRLIGQHFFDNTRGEPPFWKPQDIKTAALEAVALGGDAWEMHGTFAMETADQSRGHEGEIVGHLTVKDGRIATWRMSAVGPHWGDGPYTRGARPGRQPLGHALTLVSGEEPADRIAPQAGTWMKAYYAP
jgi:hypothetical protein